MRAQIWSFSRCLLCHSMSSMDMAKPMLATFKNCDLLYVVALIGAGIE